MSAEVEQLAFALEYYVELDAEIDRAEGDGIAARWQFGRALLRERVGRKLPAGRLDELVEVLGKSRTELQYRIRFAERYPTEIALRNAVAQCGSWHALVNEALSSTAHLSAEKDEWATPDGLFAALDAEFGFTLDVCASPANAKCGRYFTAADDGLARSWAGETAWMNPPYSEVDEWMAKARAEAAAGAVVACLVPSRTDVAWFWDTARHGQIRFIRGRLAFVDDEGNTGPAPFPSVVVVFGADYPASVVWWQP